MGGGGRARQVDAILADAAHRTDPVILAGDFNSHGVGERVRARGFLWPTRNIGHSIGPFSYDHIFVRGFGLAEGVSAGVAKSGPKASDHWPVWGVFVMRPSPGTPY
jgi:endonuclease/exonuclease/phosphatase family metal-dependent hydrolase